MARSGPVVIAIGDQTIPADPQPDADARAILDRLPPISPGHQTCGSQGRRPPDRSLRNVYLAIPRSYG